MNCVLRFSSYIQKSTGVKFISLLCLFLLALGLRIYRISPEFSSSDLCGPTSVVIDAIPTSTTSTFFPTSRSDGALAGNPFLILNYVYSPLMALLMLLNVLFLNILHIPITEAAWLLPSLLVGAGTVVLAYYLGVALSGEKAGVFCAGILCLLPIHVWQSRYAAAGDTLGFFIQTFTLFALLRYIETNKNKWAWTTGVLLGLCFYANLQWLGLLPVLAYAILLIKGGGRIQNMMTTLSATFCRCGIIFPAVFGLLSLIAIGLVIGHYQGLFFGGSLEYLIRKSGMTKWGFYIPYYVQFLPADAGFILTILIPFFVILGLIDIIHLRKRSIFWFWSICYSFPYCFLVSPEITVPSNYYGPGIQAMSLYIATCFAEWSLSEIRWNRILVASVAGLTMLSLLYTTVITAYNLQELNIGNLKKQPGMYVPSGGFKAAGYWLRSHTETNAKIFVFEYGGAGMEPNVSSYYFNRTIIGMYDAPSSGAMLAHYRKWSSQADYLAIRPKDHTQMTLLDKTLFPHHVADIRGTSGEVLLNIYSARNPLTLTIVDDVQASRMFDHTFGNLNSFRGERKLAALYGTPPGPRTPERQ